MKIIQLSDGQALCEADGVRRQVDVFLLSDQKLQIGDYLLVHVGYAIQKLQKENAEKTLGLIDQLSPCRHA